MSFGNWMHYYKGWRTIIDKYNMSHVTSCVCANFDLYVCTYLKIPTLEL